MIANLGNSPGGDLYNGIDENSACNVSNIVIRNMSIINVYAACVTMEGGLGGVGVNQISFYNNICDLLHPVYNFIPVTNNQSNGIYWTRGVVQSGNFHNNAWLLNNAYLTHDSVGGGYPCSSYLTNAGGTGVQPWVDYNSQCFGSSGNAGYHNYGTNDFTLAPGSPLIGAGAGGLNIGGKGLFGAVSSYAGRLIGKFTGVLR